MSMENTISDTMEERTKKVMAIAITLMVIGVGLAFLVLRYGNWMWSP